MRAYQEPLDALFEVYKDFARYPGMRLLHVRTDADLHGAAADLAMGVEYHADNRSPFYRLDGVHAPGVHEGWSKALREQHAARAEGMAAEGLSLPPLSPLAVGVESSGFEAFAATLVAMLGARCEPLEGVVLVLAPVAVADPARLDADVRALLASPALSGLRVVLIEADAVSLSEETRRALTRARAFHAAEARVDRALERAHLAATVDAAGRAPPGAPAAALSGGAWPPGEVPPRRPHDPEPMTPERVEAMAAEHGVPKGLLDGSMLQARNAILASTLALRDGDPLRATTLQLRAAQLTHGAGMPREGMVFELLAATSLIQSGERDMALDRYRDVARRAEAASFHDLASQALMAIGAMELLGRDRLGASVSYGQAGKVARDGGVTKLAIEGYRMAGHLALGDGNREAAVGLLEEALQLADGLEPPEQKQTSAPLAARELAAEYRRRGDDGRAVTLEARAQAMEG